MNEEFFDNLKKVEPFEYGFPSSVSDGLITFKRLSGVTKRAFCDVFRMEMPAAIYVPDHIDVKRLIPANGQVDFGGHQTIIIFKDGKILLITSSEWSFASTLLKTKV